MKIALLHSVAGESCKKLAEALRENGHQVEVFKPWDSGRQNFSDFDVVFAYGFSGMTYGAPRLNKSLPTQTCINKAMTFAVFNKNQIPTVKWSTEINAEVKSWWQVCVRQSLDGRKAEGLDWVLKGEKLPKAALYTEAHPGPYEYRVVCFMGKCVGVYYKREIDGMHHFKLQSRKGFEQLIKDAEKASKALGIDYVGYDVIARNKRSYAFLEANSGPMLTDEAQQAIINYFNGE